MADVWQFFQIFKETNSNGWRTLRHRRQRRERVRRFRAQQNRAILETILFMFENLQFMRPDRHIWQKERSCLFWDQIVNRAWGPEEWLENFRMTRRTFNVLCNIVRPIIKRQRTNMRIELSVELRVATLLMVLGSTSEYRFIANLLGISKASVSCIITELCTVICSFVNKFIKLPTVELDRVVGSYRDKWGFPNCGGAIDGSHIPIISPKENHCDYFNRKCFYSIILQGVCNDRYEFTNINVGWPGRVHDARVFKNSLIHQIGEKGKLFNNKTVKINNKEVQIVLLGDPAYPLLPWLMKGFSDDGRLTPAQKQFNYMLSRSRMTIENAFGRLKGRWRRLLKRIDMSTDIVPQLVTTCCILHNICEREHDPFREEWFANTNEIYNVNVRHNNGNNAAPQTSVKLRDLLMEYFN